MSVVRETIGFAERPLTLETGRLAKQADASVLVSYGDTVVLVTVVHKKVLEKRDFLPLLVEYREHAYAAGKIPGGYIKREGKPQDREILYSRAIDRAIRPRFPKNMVDEVEVIAYLLSYDMENDPLPLGLIGASAALMISPIPFDGPIGALKVGRIGGSFRINPTNTELQESEFDLFVSGSDGEINMIEFGGKEVPEDIVFNALEYSLKYIEELEEFQKKFAEKVGVPEKYEYTRIEVPQDMYDRIESEYGERLVDAIFTVKKQERNKKVQELEDEIKNKLLEEYPDAELEISQALMEIEEKLTRRRILESGIRPDGRGEKDIRPITTEVSVLPRTHGSALFTRGETQALVVTTLGTGEDVQKLSEMDPEEEKRFILHYNFPPFSTGEIKPLRGPSRREIGHGNLAEKAVAPLIPDEEEFPYTIRVVSDILESNGSSSMASVCGATLSLMDAGVPIKNMAAGISTGMVSEGEKYRLLTDILGLEDHFGDMDFKVAGTDKGITAIQLDLKRKGLPLSIIKETFERAREARMYILDIMKSTIDRPRSSVSKYAPKVAMLRVPREKIGLIIGAGGRTIKSIIEETDTTIDINDIKGLVIIAGKKKDNVQAAKEIIEKLIEDVELGKVYTGKVIRLANFGAFVEVLPGKEGLLHISEISDERINNIEDVLKVGDEIPVKIIDIDEETGRFKLSMKQADPNYKPRHKTHNHQDKRKFDRGRREHKR